MTLERYINALPVSDRQLRSLRAYAQQMFMDSGMSVEEIWFRASIRLLEEMQVIKHLPEEAMLDDETKKLKYESTILGCDKQLKFNMR